MVVDTVGDVKAKMFSPESSVRASELGRSRSVENNSGVPLAPSTSRISGHLLTKTRKHEQRAELDVSPLAGQHIRVSGVPSDGIDAAHESRSLLDQKGRKWPDITRVVSRS